MALKFRKRVVIAGASAIMLVAGCSQSGQSTSGNVEDGLSFDPIQVDFATHLGPENWETLPQVRYAEAVEEASGGRITFNFHHSESLVGADEFADALADGVIDMAALYPTYTPAKFPVANWASQLGMVPDTHVPAGYLTGNAAQMEWSMSEESLKNEFESQGIHLLTGLQFILMFDLLCTDEVSNLDDASGKTVRVAGDTWADEAKNIGMEPVFLTGAEIYEGLQRGVVDCAMVHPTSYKGLGLWDVAKHYTAANFTGWNSYYLSAGKDFWDGMPVEAKRIFWDNLPVLLEENAGGYLEENRKFVLNGGEEKDVEFHTMEDDMAKRIDEHHKNVLEEMSDNAPGEVADSKATIQARLDLKKKWAKIVDSLGFDATETETGWAAWVESEPEGNVDLKPWLTRIRKDIIEPRRP